MSVQVYTPRVKPLQWDFDPAKVSPEWAWFWDRRTVVAPFWSDHSALLLRSDRSEGIPTPLASTWTRAIEAVGEGWEQTWNDDFIEAPVEFAGVDDVPLTLFMVGRRTGTDSWQAISGDSGGGGTWSMYWWGESTGGYELCQFYSDASNYATPTPNLDLGTDLWAVAVTLEEGGTPTVQIVARNLETGEVVEPSTNSTIDLNASGGTDSLGIACGYETWNEYFDGSVLFWGAIPGKVASLAEMRQWVNDPFGPIRPMRPRTSLMTLGANLFGWGGGVQVYDKHQKPLPWNVQAAKLEPEFRKLYQDAALVIPLWQQDAAGLIDLKTNNLGTINDATNIYSGYDKRGEVWFSNTDNDTRITWPYPYFDRDEPFTLWMYCIPTLTGADSFSTIIGAHDSDDVTGDSCAIGLAQPGTSAWKILSSGQTPGSGKSATPDVDQYTTAALNWDGVTFHSYINGQLDQSVTPSSEFWISDNNVVVIGAVLPNQGLYAENTTYLIGAAWNRELSAAEHRLLTDDPFGLIRPMRQYTPWAVPEVGEGQTIDVGLATETDTAFAISWTKTMVVGLAEDTETAFAVTWAKAMDIGLASDTETAFPVVADKAYDQGLASETDTAFPVDWSKVYVLGLASETDTAFPIIWGAVYTMGLASETDTAFAITWAKAMVIGLASDTETAFSVTAEKGYSIGLATETDTGFATTWAKAMVLGLATETDTAFPVTAVGGTLVELAGVITRLGVITQIVDIT